MNVAADAKVPPFRPLDDLALLDPLASWGVNVVRLLFTWEAFEPERERYDDSYLDYIERVIDACQARGAWVILDVHQDAFSRFSTSGCGEGFPRWALPADVTPLSPDNGERCTSWNLQMIVDLETHRSWQAFHANENGVRDRYLALLDRLGERFGSHPNLLGFDMLNEPWGDEKTEIGPLYEAAARVLRARAPQALLFVSPHALTSGGLDTELVRPSFDNFVFSPHYYDGGVLLLGYWGGEDLTALFDRMQGVADVWGVPLLLGELGAPAEAQGGLDYVDALYAQLDRHFASAAHWAFAAHWRPLEKDGWNREDLSVVDDRGQLRANYRVRPFAARIAGVPGAFEAAFASAERASSATLRWNHAPESGATRLFVAPQGAFGGAVRVEQEGEQLTCQLEHDGLHVACQSPVAGPKTVRVLPCELGHESCLKKVAPPAPAPEPPAQAPTPEPPAKPSGPGSMQPRGKRGGCQILQPAPSRSWGLMLVLALGLCGRRYCRPRKRR